MKPKEFLDKLSDDAVVAAIGQAEARTSGEIRVFVSHRKVDDPVAAAHAQFARLKMDRTRDRNGVLIFVAPTSQTFAIVGDAGVHERCGQGFWTAVAAEMRERFARAEWTDGVVHAIRKAGDLLAEHFPRRADDVNELPDRVERDG
jgi:uncharacterized membrane protein